MATLTNEKIKLTYAGLIKTNDSGAIGAVAKPLSDGLGNAINMEVLTGQINFPSGIIDFTGSTVNGLPIATPAGLIPGTGTGSMKSADTLTTLAANASGQESIALGANAKAINSFAVAVGKNTTASGPNGVALGVGANANFSSGACMAIGSFSSATSNETTAVGYSADATGNNSTAIGSSSLASASGAVALGRGVTAATVDTVTIKKLQMLSYATLDFVDDAAAATGGIPLGGVYHTSGALKIRIV